MSGLIFAFTPARFFRVFQAHLTSIQWVPFSLAFLQGYVSRGRRRDLHLALACLALQVLTSGHGAALLVVSIPLAFSSFLALLYAAVVGLPLIYLEARFEDRYLAGRNGDDYQKYVVETNLFIPGIF